MRVRFGDLTFDAEQRQVTRADGETLHLTPKAFDLLAALIDAAPRVLKKSELHDRLWPGVFVSDAALAGLVKELRKVVQDRSLGEPVIRTAHGVGYAFCAPLQQLTGPVTTTHWVVLSDRRISLASGQNVIGRDPGSTVWLDAAGVSRRHACIVVDGDGARLEDLGSKNGTTFGDRTASTPSITLGPFQVHRDGSSPERASGVQGQGVRVMTANATDDEQKKLWNGAAGRAWVDEQQLLDRILKLCRGGSGRAVAYWILR